MWERWDPDQERRLTWYTSSEAVAWFVGQLPVDLSQLRQRRSDVLDSTRHVYEALARSGIRFVPEPIGSGVQQRIRQPAEIFGPPFEATALEITLLFGAVCLYLGLRPILVLAAGPAGNHAFIAVPRFDPQSDPLQPTRARARPFERARMNEGYAAWLGEQIDRGVYVAVECTGFAFSEVTGDMPEQRGRTNGRLSFEAAMRAGRAQVDLADRPPRRAVELHLIHQEGGDWRPSVGSPGAQPAQPPQAPAAPQMQPPGHSIVRPEREEEMQSVAERLAAHGSDAGTQPALTDEEQAALARGLQSPEMSGGIWAALEWLRRRGEQAESEALERALRQLTREPEPPPRPAAPGMLGSDGEATEPQLAPPRDPELQPRRLQAAMPGTSRVGTPTEVRAMVALPAGEGLRDQLPDKTRAGQWIEKQDVEDVDGNLVFQPGQLFLSVEIGIIAPDFEIIGASRKRLRVPRDDDSGPVVFHLRPTTANPGAVVTLTLYQDDDEITTVSLSSVVRAPERRGRDRQPPGGAEKPHPIALNEVSPRPDAPPEWSFAESEVPTAELRRRQRCTDLAVNVQATLQLLAQYERNLLKTSDPRETLRIEGEVDRLRRQLEDLERESRKNGCP